MTHLTFTASAYYDMHKDQTVPAGFRAHMDVATPEIAAEIAASFPKFVKVKGGRRWTHGGVIGQVSFNVFVSPDGVTGAVNETGLKRLRKFLDLAEINWIAPSLNSYPTLDSFTAAAL